jgi:hypothetical protein
MRHAFARPRELAIYLRGSYALLTGLIRLGIRDARG